MLYQQLVVASCLMWATFVQESQRGTHVHTLNGCEGAAVGRRGGEVLPVMKCPETFPRDVSKK